MGFFDMFIPKDINGELENAKADSKSVVLDVRTIGEYSSGHIPGSINIPVDQIDDVAKKYADKTTPLYIYCLSGARSAGAARALNHMGYTKVVDMGGIGRYTGQLER